MPSFLGDYYERGRYLAAKIFRTKQEKVFHFPLILLSSNNIRKKKKKEENFLISKKLNLFFGNFIQNVYACVCVCM
jgi:hypothetical protein